MLSLFGSPQVLWHIADDRDCVPAAVQHDENAHRVGEARAHAPQHCYLCHWAQAFRSVTPAASGFVSPQLPSGSLRLGFATTAEQIPVWPLPGRAPPA
jgi:hypothetical protein